jgi:uroporphyrinogen decarboxylase
MTKMQRVLATLKGEETDRVPFSAYVHSTVHQRTPQKLAQFTMDFYKKYDPDYVKVMFDEQYDMPVNFFHVIDEEVWKLFERFDPHIGAFGRQIETLKKIKDEAGADVPVIQTLFSPFYIAFRLAGRRILEDWKHDPEAVRHGIDMIAANTVAFAEAAVAEAGIDGFFFAAVGCEKGWMSEAQYKEMVMPSDLATLETLNKSPICMVHIHSEKDSYFDLLIDYPGNGISWEAHQAGPSMAQVKKQTDKCLVGGIDHYLASKCSPEEIVGQVEEAIQITGGRSLILAPGCTFFNDTPEENMLALKGAVGA